MVKLSPEKPPERWAYHISVRNWHAFGGPMPYEHCEKLSPVIPFSQPGAPSTRGLENQDNSRPCLPSLPWEHTDLGEECQADHPQYLLFSFSFLPPACSLSPELVKFISFKLTVCVCDVALLSHIGYKLALFSMRFPHL